MGGEERERERDSGEKGADKQRRWLKENRNCLLLDVVSMVGVITPPPPFPVNNFSLVR